MTLRTGVYMVPINRWYIERTVWLIAGFVLLASTALALLANPLWILGVAATGLASINVALTGFCPEEMSFACLDSLLCWATKSRRARVARRKNSYC